MTEVATIKLSQGKFVVVDAADLERLAPYRWYAKANPLSRDIFYAAALVDGRHTYMHRFLVGAPKGTHVDHINADGLDNRRCNIRICTASENARNRRKMAGCLSQYKGVSFNSHGARVCRWSMVIAPTRKNTIRKYFATELEAAQAYDTAAKQYFGPFARLNFPDQTNLHDQSIISHGAEQCLSQNVQKVSAK